jgi:hypothetical protein
MLGADALKTTRKRRRMINRIFRRLEGIVIAGIKNTDVHLSGSDVQNPLQVYTSPQR